MQQLETNCRLNCTVSFLFCKHFTGLIKEMFEISIVTYCYVVIVTRMVIFNVKICEVQSDSVAVVNLDNPRTVCVVIIRLRIVWRMDFPTGSLENTTTA